MNNEPELIDDVDIESEISEEGSGAKKNEAQTTADDEVSGDALDDSQLGQDLGQLITEIRQDEEDFQQSSEKAAGDFEADPFDPSHFSLDTPFRSAGSRPGAAATAEGVGTSTASDQVAAAAGPGAGASSESDDATETIAQLVSEIETALQRYTAGERRRADQRIAEKEAQVAEQYRKVSALADKVAKQKAQIQEARNELKAKLELADRLHIEFDSIRQVLNGKLGALELLDKEEEAAQ